MMAGKPNGESGISAEVVEPGETPDVARFLAVSLHATEASMCLSLCGGRRHTLADEECGLALEVVRQLFVEVGVGASASQEGAKAEPEGVECFHMLSSP